jgi:hypothetical protein
MSQSKKKIKYKIYPSLHLCETLRNRVGVVFSRLCLKHILFALYAMVAQSEFCGKSLERLCATLCKFSTHTNLISNKSHEDA